ncbi:heptaprenyl diphosphate synthase component 1 [Salibacterium salarium]|uniref:heptaprenyl diphosphate synthase component 1 n=1 Tax=Salibacterium salarium TaxID=284579 RepID=UPI00163A929F|nr:heptaprenyl diphosphate synthase component 1 [Salibacterium salarium]
MRIQHQSDEVRIIEDEFLKITTHPYLKQYIEDVKIEYDLIYFLLEIMRYSELSPSEKREQILAALLVQAAFNTHEQVKLDYDGKTDRKKPRQLTVLAGDFFSSLYHAMLVKEVHSGVISVFSRAIQQINEEKMSLHFNENSSEEELIKRLNVVEGSFLIEISTFYGEEKLGALAETFFLLKRLINEQKSGNDKYLSAFSFAIHAFWEGEELEKVHTWPPKNTKQWMSELITALQKQLQDKLQTYSFIHDTPLYDRLLEWISFENELEIK